MSGPKHLWSGDWEDESAAAAERLAAWQDESADPEPTWIPPAAPRPTASRPTASPRPAAPPRAAPRPVPKRARRRLSLPGRRVLRAPIVLGVVALLLVVGGAYGLNALLSSDSGTSNAPFGPVGTGSSRPVAWLGMEIVTQPPGVAVVETVRPGSLGDRAGLNPGDVLLEINNQVVRGAGDIAAAIRGLHPGDQVDMQISHGSALYVAKATLAAPPTAYP